MRVQYGDLRAEIISESQSWNPDVATDMLTRLNSLWRESLETMVSTGTWNGFIFDDDDEDDEDEDE